ncbi:NAD(P)-dependent alcohol dehydrogenase [Mumia zhuanghuii]|uniref:alcohol dehydrogenase n=1 Tax=Mumia zhuanghuii TaxID=2585211 RepID=A0A5C4MEA5_9ACTN|nr:NAD(P)-dependent alcohol dehydrogenase [Mumia zhuanghuii]TNC37618.1 NAD(P)-dependent alcohol dehydrogenase [Mumia zhuanghuii]TNC50243.1 NAD(P)-dependent alcohol dehydrogenase [Mumia zhuanghuii]
MRALQYLEIGQPPRVVEIDTPEPGPGQIRLKVTAAGVCHSDEFVMSLPEEAYTFGIPLTLGHEGAGTVDAVGEGVENLDLGTSVAVYGPWGCGRCHACARGAENSCPYAVELGIAPPGLGAPGAMAEYLIVDDVRHLVPLGDLDPVRNVSLTDAGLTPYHAIRTSMPKLVAGSTAVVIGTGGLGHVAIQMLRALTGAQVIALDVNEEKLALAKEVGAHEAILSDEAAAEAVRGLTGGLGATAVFDFVGAPPTVAIAAASVAIEGDVQLVGIGGGTAAVGFGVTPYDASFRAPYWGTRSELIEVFDMARRDQVHVEIETYSLDEAPKAYERLHAGQVRGRAVVLPNG